MTTIIEMQGGRFTFDETRPIEISIPLSFNGPQPNAYGVEPAVSTPCAAGELIGDTRQGGSCNFEQYTLIPHCNGTHTECVGHITKERISIRDCLQDVLIPAVLISVEPEKRENSAEAYPGASDNDLLLTRRSLEQAISKACVSANSGPFALVVRTLPNGRKKLSKVYNSVSMPSYFSTEATQFIVDRGIDHLLVDLPSIDRIYDEGRLSNHRIFWSVDPGSFDVNPQTRMRATITELIFVPDTIEDGQYILNLQIAPFAADASPSRPVLFPITV